MVHAKKSIFLSMLVASLVFVKPAEAQDLRDLTARSEFLRIFFDRKSPTYSSSRVQSMSKGYQFGSEKFTLWGSDHQACPTWWWWGNTDYESSEAKRKLTSKISSILQGFPKDTIAKCRQVSPIIMKGKVTDHWRNKSAYETTVGAIALKDAKTQETVFFRALVSFDIFDTKGKSQAYLYNENLQQVCRFREVNLKKKSALASCGGLGSGRAIVEGDARSATFFLTTGKATIFAVLNSSIEKAQRKYPDIFRN